MSVDSSSLKIVSNGRNGFRETSLSELRGDLNGFANRTITIEGGPMDGNSTHLVASSHNQDPWILPDVADTSQRWSDLNTTGKIKRVFIAFGKMVGLLFMLYCFVCSLELLALGFRLVGGRTTSEIFRKNELLNNPVVGVMIGILATVLVQSSSTSSSIIVSMVSANFITVTVAIPIIMGANIGTSITNTIVSFTQIGNANEFRRAFAAATVHDMFNWLTVIVLFIIEITTGYLETVSGMITEGLKASHAEGGEIKLLTVITEPLTKSIVQINKKVLVGWSKNDRTYDNASLVDDCSSPDNGTQRFCSHMFAYSGLADWKIGLIVLVISLLVLVGCLVCIVKILNSVLKGQIAHVIKRVFNANIPYIPWITGYLALFIGAIMTFLVQSSSVFTSALTPLVGVGIISIERVYPLTLGSNIGTTTTSLIAALAADADRLQYTLQIAICHLLFNVTGILLFYPIPFTRVPITMAKFLGDTTAKYRWFSIAYLIVMFFLLPAFVFGLSLAGNTVVIVFVAIIVIFVSIVLIISLLQRKRSEWLPEFLRTWKFLPIWMRSLEPMDNFLSRLACCRNTRTTSGSQTSASINPECQRNSSSNQLTLTENHRVNGISNPTFE